MVEKKKNKKSVLFAFVFGLAIGCLISCVLLAGFLVDYAQRVTIPVVDVDLNKDNIDKDKLDNLEEYYNFQPGFKVTDAEGTWVTQSSVSIFKISYDNETGETTVTGTGSDKFIAPGTSNSYYFDLVNTGNVGLDYQVKMKAILSDNITSIPVEVKLSDHNGKYQVGSETTWENVLTLNEVVEEGKLSEGRKARYMFSWQWPYESDNDEYDTLLGNLAVNEDVTLTVEIKTLATANIDSIGGVHTGDNTQVMLYVAGAVGSCALIIFLIILGKKDKEDEEE